MNTGTLKYLLDTGWVVRHLRGKTAYTDSIARLAPEGIAISMISVAELQEGVFLAKESTKAAQALAMFLTTVTILPVEDETCRIFGELSAGFHRKGNHPGDFDTMIAATARQHGLTVLTTDSDDFSRFQGLSLITTP